MQKSASVQIRAEYDAEDGIFTASVVADTNRKRPNACTRTGASKQEAFDRCASAYSANIPASEAPPTFYHWREWTPEQGDGAMRDNSLRLKNRLDAENAGRPIWITSVV